MIVRIALLLVSIPLLAHGAEGLHRAYLSRTQTAVTCEQFTRARPASSWVKITGCEVDYVRAGYREAGGRVIELLLPLRPAGTSPAEPAPVVVSTTDPAVLALAERAINGAARTDSDAFLVGMLRVVTTMRAAREVEGLIRSRLDMLRTRGGLSAIAAPLTDDVVVLDFRERPHLVLPAIEAILGAQALLVLLFLSVKARRLARAHRIDEAPAEAPAEAWSAPVLDFSAEPRRPPPAFRRLMLVNLPPYAAVSALEDAPPLGTQTDVRRAFSNALPGIRFNDFGLGQFNSVDHTILVDLGTKPQVWTVTLDVTGDAAADALDRLVKAIGWRVYAPKLGRFLTVGDTSRAE